jgi:hypothetical protein
VAEMSSPFPLSPDRCHRKGINRKLTNVRKKESENSIPQKKLTGIRVTTTRA